MNTIKSKIVALLTAAVMAAALIMPVASLMPRHTFAENTAEFETPAGYNDNDYQKLVAFLETTTSSGVKNGELINPNVYTPEDPSTWLYSTTYDWGTVSYGVYWEEIDGEMRFVAFDNGFSCRVEGNVDFSECEYLVSVFMSSCDIPTANFAFCTGLQAIHITYSNLTQVNVSCCYNMVQIDVFGNSLTSEGVIGLPECTALRTLNIQDNPNLEDIDISAVVFLIEVLNVNNTALGDDDIDFTRLESIQEINITGTNVTKVDARNCVCMTALTCRDMPLEYVKLPSCDSNLQVDCTNTGISELDVTGCTGLYQLNCDNNPIRILDLTNSPWIQFVSAQNCELEVLNLAGCENLIAVSCENNNLTELDISAAGQLSQLYCTGNKLTEIYWHLNNEWDGEIEVSLASEGNGYIAIGFEVDPETYDAINFFEATPQEGYHFVHWIDADGNEVSSDSRFIYQARTPYDMIAVFAADEIPVETPEPQETPEPTETTEPGEPTEIPEPGTTDEPTTPDVPTTGAVSLCVLGVAIIVAGGALITKKKED